MEKPISNSPEKQNLILLKNFGLTQEEFQIAEENWANLDKNSSIILCFTSSYRKGIFVSKDFIISLLESHEDNFEELINYSDQIFSSIFCDTFFGENNHKGGSFGEMTYRIKTKYSDFIKNKAYIFSEYLDSLEI